MSTCTKTVAEGILEGQLQDRTGRECCQAYFYYDRSNAEPDEPPPACVGQPAIGEQQVEEHHETNGRNPDP
jgi:hypothetical protein